MRCPYCGTPKFRISRIRFGDLPRLALLQFPVRCKSCRERFHVGLSLAMNILQSERVRKREESALHRAKLRDKENNTIHP